jgi:hypothetical protein
MTLEEIARWHRTRAGQLRNEAEGQRWSAEHNPNRRQRHLNLARQCDLQALWHEQAAEHIDAAIAELQGEPDCSDIPEATAADFARMRRSI